MFIRIGIVDDHKVICDGIKNVIEYKSNHSVVFQAHSGKDCFEQLLQCKNNIDVLLLDISMPDYNGFEILHRIRKENDNIKVIFITADDNIEILLDAINVGVDGFLLKDVSSKELFQAIELVYFGERYIQSNLIGALNIGLIARNYPYNLCDNLTHREKEIMEQVATGKINKEIAFELDISEGTVKNHLSNIFRKFGVNDRTQAAVLAVRNELV